MKAWENNLTMPVGIDIFWEEHRRGDAAPRRELLERWEIMYVGELVFNCNLPTDTYDLPRGHHTIHHMIEWSDQPSRIVDHPRTMRQGSSVSRAVYSV